MAILYIYVLLYYDAPKLADIMLIHFPRVWIHYGSPIDRPLVMAPESSWRTFRLLSCPALHVRGLACFPGFSQAKWGSTWATPKFWQFCMEDVEDDNGWCFSTLYPVFRDSEKWRWLRNDPAIPCNNHCHVCVLSILIQLFFSYGTGNGAIDGAIGSLMGWP